MRFVRRPSARDVGRAMELWRTMLRPPPERTQNENDATINTPGEGPHKGNNTDGVRATG